MFSKRLVFADCEWSASHGPLSDLNPLIDALGGVIDWPDESAESIWAWAVDAARLVDFGSSNPRVLNTVLGRATCTEADRALLSDEPITRAEVLLVVLDWLLMADDKIPAFSELAKTVKNSVGDISASPSHLAVGYALKQLDEAGEDSSELRKASAAASVLMLEVAFWRGKDVERDDATKLRSKGGKARAAKLVENPEKAVAIEFSRKNPELSALQIRTRAKLRASERTIRGWISAAC
ncbi:hypothetical protein [Arenimonas sp.]|uniref:hypothetical protein n=1 Tax=Arenimonas sp. TaxID=1872635 RepID=UPI002E319B5E|nr:hypothetical protein [Arenimonas sp.]HEX4852758.1 hypothetical protein [Arenimonas sp.]